ncbi:hypothetical protein H1R16_10460 [Marnyiella aurantia]|uniref:Uncharacterized protein n=1 Tax=Marnyiella aurantia TaxID=2758037 RepID=A0A7D7RJM9_9FLAO|nr:hypothetical protein [Marnyiella aurantia]MBA5246523.1 hypothetical protein [Marnyiella aurantia]MBP0613610.1 hypothetical protein [Marnyiella aurantia]QMS98112.1 hypothetical protein H1R16_10460 [Marnyiella aurantia]
MKYILPFTALFLASCSSSNDKCDCTQQRWERTVEYQGTTSTVYAATPWTGQGTEVAIGSDDCTMDGTIASSGVETSTVLPNGNTKKDEYEFRVTCN